MTATELAAAPRPFEYGFVTAPHGAPESAHVVRLKDGFGGFLARDEGRIVCRVYLLNRDEPALLAAMRNSGFDGAPTPPPHALLPAVEVMERYFAGDPVDPAALPLLFDPCPVGAFGAAVYSALRRVRRGDATTYGDLAEAAGKPRAARAVGMHMRLNRLPLFVPCHRVLARGGGLGGFSSSGGVEEKRLMLRLEGRAEALSCVS